MADTSDACILPDGDPVESNLTADAEAGAEPTPTEPAAPVTGDAPKLNHISPDHLAELAASGISHEVASRAGISTVSSRAAMEALRWKHSSDMFGDCLAYPFFDLNGKPMGYGQVKPSKPRPDKKKKGKVIKYETQSEGGNRIYFPRIPGLAERVKDPGIVLVVTEGPKKALCGAIHGFANVALPGVWNFGEGRPKDATGRGYGPWKLVTDWDDIPLNGRTVAITYDSDGATNEGVQWAERTLAKCLRARGAIVRAVRLPALPNGEKCGQDDFLMSFSDRDEAARAFAALIESAVPIDDGRKSRSGTKTKTPSPTASQQLPPSPPPGGDDIPTAQSEADPDEIPRVCILLNGNEDHKTWLAAVRILAERLERFFAKGGELVRVVEHKSPAGDSVRKDPSRVELQSVAKNHPMIHFELSKFIDFRLITEDENIPKKPPTDLVKWVAMNAASEPGVTFRHIRSVLNVPSLCGTEGRLISASGYDAASGLFLSPFATSVAIPDAPQVDDVQAAIATLWDVVAQFPFIGGRKGPHFAAWVAALITPLVIQCYEGPTPLFLFDANIQGIGKTTLADLVSAVVYGGHFPLLSYENNDEEMRKKLTTFLQEGRECVLIDNVKGVFGGPFLEGVLTGKVWSDRLLGTNKSVTVPLSILWYATANNVTLTPDVARRVCYCRLHSDTPRPEDRSDFKYPDVVAHVIANRSKYLSAALTFVRGYFAAERPHKGLPEMGSYTAWSSVVRQAIVWAGLADPRDAIQSLRDRADPTRELVANVVALLGDMYPDGRPFTVAELWERIDGKKVDHDLTAALYQLIDAKKSKLDPRDVGQFLSGNADQPTLAGRIERLDEKSRKNTRLWRIVPLPVVHAPSSHDPCTPDTPGNSSESSKFAGAAGTAGMGSSVPKDVVPKKQPKLPRRNQSGGCAR